MSPERILLCLGTIEMLGRAVATDSTENPKEYQIQKGEEYITKILQLLPEEKLLEKEFLLALIASTQSVFRLQYFDLKPDTETRQE